MMLLAADAIGHTHNDWQLVLAALLGIATVVVLITWLKVHPFLALILGSAVLGVVAAVAVPDIVTSFTTGVGATVGSVGLLIALGAMIGGMLAESGGASSVVHAFTDRVSPGKLPWVMGGVAALVGIPLFFEVGVVLLVPIVLLAAVNTRQPVLRVGIPALAGLSVLHGLVPPHPGPLVAIAALHADLGRTLIFGLICAIPTVIIAGPLFGEFISRRVPLAAARTLVGARAGGGGAVLTDEPGAATPAGRPAVGGGGVDDPRDVDALDARDGAIDTRAGGLDDREAGLAPRRRPSLGPTVLTVLLPVILMLLRAIGELTLDDNNSLRKVLDVVGTPVIAMLAGVIVAMFTLGTAVGFGREKISATLGGSLPAIAGILLIVAAGGGFKQVLVDSGVGELVGSWAKGANVSVLILGWLVAVLIRLATGSATVATITAAGIVSPLAHGQSASTVALLVLAIGAGSVFFSHVNDAGFWLVKEYFGMTVWETIKSWSVMETIISVVGLLAVLLLSVVV
jgi:GntP family gluconate:H+ symporter